MQIHSLSKKKATTEQILTQLKKYEQNEGLILCSLDGEIATFIQTVMLHSKENNSLFIANSLNTPEKEQTTRTAMRLQSEKMIPVKKPLKTCKT